MFSWLTGRNQKPTSVGTGNGNGGVMTVARHGNSDGGGTVSVRLFGSHGNAMNGIVLEEPEEDMNF